MPTHTLDAFPFVLDGQQVDREVRARRSVGQSAFECVLVRSGITRELAAGLCLANGEETAFDHLGDARAAVEEAEGVGVL